MKALKKQNKMLLSITKRSSSCRELKKINNICAKASNKRDYSSRDISTSDYDSSLSSNSEWDKIIHPYQRKDMNKLDHAVINNINNKDQCNDAIEYDPKFYNKVSLYSGTKDPLPVVIFSLRGGKKRRSTIISGLKCMFCGGYTDSLIKSWHTKPYQRKIYSNKVEYSTPTGPYCTMHDAKVSFFMTEFSSRNITSHRFHVDNNEGESGIVY